MAQRLMSSLRRMAKQRLPAPMFHYIDGGSDDEWSLRRNTAAFDDYELIPNYLRDISAIDTSTTLLGQKISWPVFLAPTGMSRLFHHEAEPAVARLRLDDARPGPLGKPRPIEIDPAGGHTHWSLLRQAS